MWLWQKYFPILKQDTGLLLQLARNKVGIWTRWPNCSGWNICSSKKSCSSWQVVTSPHLPLFYKTLHTLERLVQEKDSLWSFSQVLPFVLGLSGVPSASLLTLDTSHCLKKQCGQRGPASWQVVSHLGICWRYGVLSSFSGSLGCFPSPHSPLKTLMSRMQC